MTDRVPAIYKVLDRSTTTGTARHVLIAIASYADPNGENAWPSLRRIADRAGLTSQWADRTVRRNIDRLQEAGELEVLFKGGPNGCNLYTVTCARDVDTATSTSPDVDTAPPRYVDTATSTSAVSPPGHSGSETWTSEPTDVDTSAPSSGHSSAPQPEEPGSLNQENEQDSAFPDRNDDDHIAPEQWAELNQRIGRGLFKRVPA